MLRVCLLTDCKKPLTVKQIARNGKYCSHPCATSARALDVPERQCIICNKPLTVRQISHGGKLCSRTCFSASLIVDKPLRLCEICDKPLTEEQTRPSKIKNGGGRFCSRPCMFAAKMKKRGLANCVICGATSPAPSSLVKAGRAKTCSPDCLSALRSQRTGKESAGWKGGKVECVCENCGTSFDVHPSRISDGRGKFCGVPCHMSWMNKRKEQNGDKNHNWQGGKSFEPYDTDWTKTRRKQIRERDSYTCVLCGALDSKECHHIDYCKTNSTMDNLVTLCQSCHSKTNYNRERWQVVLTEIMQAGG